MNIRHPRIYLNIAIEFGPLLIFFLVAEPLGFVPAVGVFIVLTVASVFLDLWLQRRFAIFPVVVAIFIVGFGGATVISGNPRFIELNYTVYPAVFGCVALADILVFRNRIFKKVFGGIFAIDDRGWFLTTRNWVLVFAAMALANEFARSMLPPERWIVFRIIMTVMILVFSGYQFTIARRHRLPEANEFGLRVL